jgi:hypothetical protein
VLSLALVFCASTGKAIILTKKLDPNFPESQIHTQIQRHLSLAGFPYFDYLIKPITQQEEAEVGYDATIEYKMLPFYMQFKRPFLADGSQNPDVLDSRDEVTGYRDEHALFFHLYRRKYEEVYRNRQHNILHELSKQNPGRVAYICPLFTDLRKYTQEMQVGRFDVLLNFLRHNDPISLRPMEILVSGSRSRPVRIADIPMLRGHVSIPPHAEVDDSPHRYSFAEDGTRVCFHSPLAISDGSQRLDVWLRHIYDSRQSESFDPHSEVGRDRFQSVASALADYIPSPLQKFEGSTSWGLFGSLLMEQYNIFQFSFISRMR